MTDRAGIGTPADAAAHVVVEEVGTPALDEASEHHLRRVLRLRPGTRLTVTDGRGSWRWCRLEDTLVAEGEVVVVERASPPIEIALALTKADKPEWVVQRLSEIGADRITMFRSERSIVRWDDEKARRQVERWRMVARSAVEQSRRCWLPVIDDVCEFGEVAARRGALLADLPGRSAVEVSMRLGGPVLIGPEGGWGPTEQAVDLPRVVLGSGVLRAETAALAAGVLLSALREDLLPS